MTERLWTDWLDENVSEEEIAAAAEAEAAIEQEAEKVRQAAAQHQKPEAGEDAQEAPESSSLPPPVHHPERRVDPIFPVVVTVQEHPFREAGRLAFTGDLADGHEKADGQLPMFPDSAGPRVLLLELADHRGGPIMARGRGAPLDLRLLVAACVMTPYEARKRKSRLAVTQRELRDFLFPNGWQRNRDWPAIRRALWKAHTYEIPGQFTWADRTVNGWVPFRLAGGAGEDTTLDDLILIDVELPPRSAAGPAIDRRKLAQLGVTSAPRFRAYIAAHSLSWRPGITRRRHPRNRGVHLWSANPAHYPVLTAQDRDRLAFGDVDRARKEGRRKANTHWEDLPGVEVLTRTATTPDGRRGWLIVPEGAADAIRGGGGDPPREETVGPGSALAADSEDFDS